MSMGCPPQGKCAPNNKNRVCFLEPMKFHWRKSYIIAPRDNIKSYEILHCPCYCSKVLEKQKRENRKMMRESKKLEKSANARKNGCSDKSGCDKEAPFVMKKFQNAKPKVDCKRKKSTGCDNQAVCCSGGCCYTPACSNCYECCFPCNYSYCCY